MTATIIDLAVRGYLKIEEVEKEWYQFKHDWMLTKLEKDEPLRQYERSLYDGLFKSGDEVKLSDLKNTFAARMTKVREQLMDDAMSKGWFTRQARHGEGAVEPARVLRARRRDRAHRSCWRSRRTPRCSAFP